MSLPGKISCLKLPGRLMVPIIIAFLIYSITFIYRTSFVLFDGIRYFALFDDAMITMRYAWNFSQGAGPVWNPGERVEGYTNPLMLILMTLVTFFFDKRASVLIIQFIGILTLLGVAWFTALVATRLFEIRPWFEGRRSMIQIVSFTTSLLYYPLIYWTLMGMETGLLSLFILASFYYVSSYVKDNRPSYLLMLTTALSLAYLTRPDALIAAALLLGYFLAVLVKSSQPAKKKLKGFLFVTSSLLLVVLAHVGVRLSYYGEIFPTTFVLKATGMELSDRLQNGIGFIQPFLKESSLVLALGFASLIFLFSQSKLVIFTIFSAYLGYQIFVGGEPWSYWRMFAPVMPLFLLLVIDLTFSYVTQILNSRIFYGTSLAIYRKRILSLLSLMLLSLLILSLNSRFLGEMFGSTTVFHVTENRIMATQALIINFATDSRASVGVVWAGIIPYYTGRKAVDILGKSDKKIAVLPPDISGAVAWNGMYSVPGHNKYDLNYSVKQLRPDYVQFLYWGTQNLEEWAKSNYVTVQFENIKMHFSRSSQLIFWDKLSTFTDWQPLAVRPETNRRL